MSDDSLILNLPYIQPSQAQKHVTHNEAIRALDVLVHLSVKSQSVAAAPITPIAGDRYVVAAGGSGAWAGQDAKVAMWDGVAWAFHTPNKGWRAWVEDEGNLSVFEGSAWVLQTGDFQNLGGIGINTSSDTVNKIAVAADASLFSHDGAGHQVKVNKNAASDTASLLFQTGFSGRAEMGLAGDDTFQIKASADGSTWAQGIVVDGSGKVGIGQSAGAEALQVAGNVLADAYLAPSDARLKTNIQNATPAPDLIDSLRVVSFDWITGGEIRFGLIAQEVAQVLPEAVQPGGLPDQPWSIDPSRLVPLLVLELQALRARVAALESAAP
ncbi:DUF2793 domain-containing protein [Actibacterium pelagium]|uniref:Peptidase S74 domain-containing protein n=1 Tax=Actibacterium pelagium TaxID=2029103 RepID=A0A917AHQ8_9RHOB|nr:DUF2793 domain-containing protein [Actibacterium pelagium]GGE54582.1 hypothetical protein GCM10011517_22770 [Actibacterium pelagium]